EGGGGGISCRSLNTTVAQWPPERTSTLPSAGVVESSVQPDGTISVTVCVPAVTLVNGAWQEGLFTVVPSESSLNVNCATGVIGFPCVSNVSLITTTHPFGGGGGIVWRSLNTTVAQFPPDGTMTRPPAGVIESSVQPAGIISVIVCAPAV